jgi:transcriptional regulator with XRE-family HTH domain
VKSQGSSEFERAGKTGAEWARLLGVTPAAVCRWRSGQAKPTAELRTRIHSAGGPSPKAWDQVAGTPPPTKKKGAPKRAPQKATPQTVIEEADRWLAELQDFRDELPSLISDAKGRASLLANAAKTLAVLGKLTGVGLSISERQILDSPNWRLIEARIIEALKPWPDALRALGKALDRSRSGGS